MKIQLKLSSNINTFRSHLNQNVSETVKLKATYVKKMYKNVEKFTPMGIDPRTIGANFFDIFIH